MQRWTNPGPPPASATASRSWRCCAAISPTGATCWKSAAAPASTRCISPRALPHLRWQTSDVAANLPRHPPVAGRRGAAEHAGAAGARRQRACAGRALRRGLQRQHAAHHELARGHAVLRGTRPAAGIGRAAGRLRAVQPRRRRSAAPATRPSMRRCAPPTRAAASATSKRSMRWPDAAGLQLLEDGAMPANNRCIVWRKG